ncbi:MAG: hypothetical protein LRZ85_05255, partial [Alphaproteobacteria bacterium]|nr:hypothetical protein [Alphaproteobacteria bacterium]
GTMFQATTPQTPGQTAARHAEAGDARMTLRRREEENRRGGSQQRRTKNNLQNDEASVSVEALEVFLENLLRADTARQDNAKAINSAAPSETILKTAIPANAASPSALAAKAYANASRTARRRVMAEPDMETAIITPASAPRPRLNTTEKAQIAVIKENLAALSQLGVQNLSIQRGETFLISLVDSTQKALNG